MILEKINADIVDNMKSKNMVDLTILRTLKSDIAKVSIDTKKAIDDAMCIDVMSKSCKQFNDALEIYSKANNDERIAETKHRLELISKYLPAQLTEDEVVKLVNELKIQLGATNQKDMGRLMKELTPRTKGKFDSKKLSQIVQNVLSTHNV